MIHLKRKRALLENNPPATGCMTGINVKPGNRLYLSEVNGK